MSNPRVMRFISRLNEDQRGRYLRACVAFKGKITDKDRLRLIEQIMYDDARKTA